MSEVINLPEPEENQAWQCECGAFYILDNHEAECCHCGEEIDLFDMY